jgi:acyl-CoA thioesterase-1
LRVPGGDVELANFTSPPRGEVGTRLRVPGGDVELANFTSPPRGEVGTRLRVPGGDVEPAIAYLALGDSYTIGTGASDEAHNYPSIVAARLTAETGREVAVTNPAVNGFTTLDLIRSELGHLDRRPPQLVSALIGVNDIVQGRSAEHYRESLIEIYDRLSALELPPGLAVSISIPDWSVVPAASGFGDPARLRRLTEAFNDIARRESEARRLTWIDITAASRSGLGKKGWIASDDLHPGDPQYAAWAEVIWEAVKDRWVAAATPRP